MAFAQQVSAARDTQPEVLCSKRCGRGRTQDAVVERSNHLNITN
jgi:hypothetical protein